MTNTTPKPRPTLDVRHVNFGRLPGRDWANFAHQPAQAILAADELRDVDLPHLTAMAREWARWDDGLDAITAQSIYPPITSPTTIPTPAEWAKSTAAQSMVDPAQWAFALWRVANVPPALAADTPAIIAGLQTHLDAAVAKITDNRDALEGQPPSLLTLQNVPNRNHRIAIRDAMDAADEVDRYVQMVGTLSATPPRTSGIGGVLCIEGTDERHADVIEAESRNDQEWRRPLAIARAAAHGRLILRSNAEALAADDRRDEAERRAAEAKRQAAGMPAPYVGTLAL